MTTNYVLTNTYMLTYDQHGTLLITSSSNTATSLLSVAQWTEVMLFCAQFMLEKEESSCGAVNQTVRQQLVSV